MGEDASTAATAAATPPEPVLTVGPLTIAPARHEVSMHDRPVDCNARGHLMGGPRPAPGWLCQFPRESFRSDFGSHSGAGIVINVSDF